MNNIPQDKQNIDNIPDNNHCFKCGGELEVIEDNDGRDDLSCLRCVKCGQENNWYEKEQWEKKGKK